MPTRSPRDGHKWLNVPYDCGFAFVRDPARLARALNVGAPYLPSGDDPHPELRVHGARELAARPRARRLGDALRLRPLRVSRDGRAPPRARAAPGAPSRRRARARAPGRGAAEHRLLPGSARRRSRVRPRRPQPGAGRRAPCATAASSPEPRSTTARSPFAPRSSTGAPREQDVELLVDVLLELFRARA